MNDYDKLFDVTAQHCLHKLNREGDRDKKRESDIHTLRYQHIPKH